MWDVIYLVSYTSGKIHALPNWNCKSTIDNLVMDRYFASGACTSCRSGDRQRPHMPADLDEFDLFARLPFVARIALAMLWWIVINSTPYERN